MTAGEPTNSKMNASLDHGKKQSKLKKYLKGWVRDILVSFAVVGTLILILYAYSGLWPFLVVVESGSMQHSAESQIGVIDTGDMVLVKKLGSTSEITTYIQGKISGYSTYGSYGDVIVYKKNGHDDATPVIHRAVLFLKYNATANAFDIPELNTPSLVPNKDWGITGSEPRWYAIASKIWIANYGHARINLTINLAGILSNVGSRHDGYITLGDNNRGAIDQTNLLYHDELVQPVKFEWIVGVARGELPWFGALKLLFTGNAQYVPANSWMFLQISIALIILVPFLVDYWLEKRARKKKRESSKAVVVCADCKTENELKARKCVKCGAKLK
ncbi:MAG: S26 family signal peptidase [Thermoplasmata archaeon]